MQIKRIFNEIFSIGDPTGDQDLDPSGSEELTTEIEKSLELLYAYIEAELDDEDASGKYPKVHAALQRSAEARIQYEDLKEILTAERNGTLIVPERVPDFDFSYLERTPASQSKVGEAGEAAWRFDRKMGQLFVEFSEELVGALRQAFPGPELAASSLRSNAGNDEIFRLTIKPQAEDLSTKFVAKSVAANESLCDITVTVERPSLGGAPLMADSRVDLMLPVQTVDPSKPQSLSEQAKERVVQYTNPFGEAIFRQIAILDLPYLQFSIEPAPLRS